MAFIYVLELLSFKKELIVTASGDSFFAPKKILRVMYDSFQLEVVVYQDRGVWYPATFYHDSGDSCPFCEERGYRQCPVADEYIDSLYGEIIESKPFRLQALFDL